MAGCSGGETPLADATEEATPRLDVPGVDVPGVDGGEAPSGLASTPDEVVAIPPTDLPLILMATLVGDEPGRGRATVRNEARGVIATYALGDAVTEDTVLAEVDRDFVVLTRGGESERLDFPVELTPLHGGETFYLDLVDLDTRTNSMDDAVQLVDGPGYMVKTPAHAWGTPRTIAAIQSAVTIYRQQGLEGPQVHIGDVSRRVGGPFPPHLSHRDGRDVDIGYVLRGPDAETTRFKTATRSSFDTERSWALLEAFLATDRVRYIFVDYGLQRLLYEHAQSLGATDGELEARFQYPRGSAANRGVIRHWRGHANHFHVRFEL